TTVWTQTTTVWTQTTTVWTQTTTVWTQTTTVWTQTAPPNGGTPTPGCPATRRSSGWLGGAIARGRGAPEPCGRLGLRPRSHRPVRGPDGVRWPRAGAGRPWPGRGWARARRSRSAPAWGTRRCRGRRRGRSG